MAYFERNNSVGRQVHSVARLVGWCKDLVDVMFRLASYPGPKRAWERGYNYGRYESARGCTTTQEEPLSCYSMESKFHVCLYLSACLWPASLLICFHSHTCTSSSGYLLSFSFSSSLISGSLCWYHHQMFDWNVPAAVDQAERTTITSTLSHHRETQVMIITSSAHNTHHYSV